MTSRVRKGRWVSRGLPGGAGGLWAPLTPNGLSAFWQSWQQAADPPKLREHEPSLTAAQTSRRRCRVSRRAHGPKTNRRRASPAGLGGEFFGDLFLAAGDVGLQFFVDGRVDGGGFVGGEQFFPDGVGALGGGFAAVFGPGLEVAPV